jgi:hypothetical protein
MRRLLFLLLFAAFAFTVSGQDAPETTAPTPQVSSVAKGVIIVDAYSLEDQYLGAITLPLNISDTTSMNDLPVSVRDVLITYTVQGWFGPPTIYQTVLTTSNWYNSGNDLLWDLLETLDSNTLKNIDNPKRKQITIIWTGPVRPGLILSTGTEGWLKGRAILN